MSEAASPSNRTVRLERRSAFALGGPAVLLVSLSIAVSVGAVPVPAGTVWSILVNKISPGLIEQTWSQGREAIVWEIRFPRALLAIMVGAGLALVGASLQAVTRNPLADPHLLGISSGGAFGAIFALLHAGLFLGLLTVPLLAFVGALMATIIVLGVSRLADATSADRLVLAGVAVSFIIMAGANGLIFLGDPRASHTVVFWMLGGLGLAQWGQLVYPLVILLACGVWLTRPNDPVERHDGRRRDRCNARHPGGAISSRCFRGRRADHRGDGGVFGDYRFRGPDGPACRAHVGRR